MSCGDVVNCIGDSTALHGEVVWVGHADMLSAWSGRYYDIKLCDKQLQLVAADGASDPPPSFPSKSKVRSHTPSEFAFVPRPLSLAGCTTPHLPFAVFCPPKKHMFHWNRVLPQASHEGTRGTCGIFCMFARFRRAVFWFSPAPCATPTAITLPL